MQIKFKKLYPSSKAPTKAHSSDAGFDLFCYDRESVYDQNLGWSYIYKSGISIEIPEGYFGLLVPRSSVYKTKQILSNCAGVIDSGYRGEIIARFSIFSNNLKPNSMPPIYEKNDRFAQLLILPVPSVELIEADELSHTDRGEGGFGSSGK